MARIAPIMKISNCRSYGAVVIVEGQDMAEVDDLYSFFYSVIILLNSEFK
jgi:hypothetical protein